MYKKSTIAYVLFLCSFFAVHSFAAQIPDKAFACEKMGDFLLQYKSPEEGFCAGTLVKTPLGYEPIEDLQVGDTVLDMYGNQTQILAITRRYVDGYIKFFLHDTVLSVGCDQLLYSLSDSTWIKSRDLLSDSEQIVDPTIIYALTVQNHTLSVTTSDIGAHNAVAILAGASSISYGYVAVINPVIAVLGGATVALGVVAYNAYQRYLEKYDNTENVCLVDLPDTVVLAERVYYEQRKQELENIRQELMGIKNDLQIIKGLFSGCLTHQLLRQHIDNTIKNVQILSVAQEKKLSADQKSTLRDLRENELASLEKQICDIQLVLALHVNQLIDNLQHAHTSYDSAIAEIKEAVVVWNNNRTAITHKMALRLYKYDLLRELLLCGIRQAFDELLLVAEYYRMCNSHCIQSSTTVLSVFDLIMPLIHENESWILQEKEIARNSVAIDEAHFASRNVSVLAFKNEAKKEFDQQKKDRGAQVLKKAETEISVNSFSGGPKKDDDDDDDDPEDISNAVKISEDDAPHMFANRPGHLIDTPANRELLISLASNKKNFLGIDRHCNEWYAKIMKDGKQLWASVRNCVIRNGGINSIPRKFDPKTGLCKPFK